MRKQNKIGEDFRFPQVFTKYPARKSGYRLPERCARSEVISELLEKIPVLSDETLWRCIGIMRYPRFGAAGFLHLQSIFNRLHFSLLELH